MPARLPVKYLSFAVTALASGSLTALLLFFYMSYKLKVSPWFFYKDWFFFTLGVVISGVTLEAWLARRERREKETEDDRREPDKP